MTSLICKLFPIAQPFNIDWRAWRKLLERTVSSLCMSLILCKYSYFTVFAIFFCYDFIQKMGNSTAHERRPMDDFGPSLVPGGKLSVASSDSGHLKIGSPSEPSSSSSSLNDASSETKTLPTVFRWDGPGKNVYIAGSYDNWTSRIPLVHRCGTIRIPIPVSGICRFFLLQMKWE